MTTAGVLVQILHNVIYAVSKKAAASTHHDDIRSIQKDRSWAGASAATSLHRKVLIEERERTVTKSRIGVGIGVAVVGMWFLGQGTASATMATLKKAKEAGFPATNCLYCHEDKLPKKEAHAPNERGKFLIAEKEKHKAKEIDVNWLKDYKEQK